MSQQTDDPPPNAMDDMAKAQTLWAASQHWPHDCLAWNATHYILKPDYTASACGHCGTITGFRWRSWRKRLWSLFSSDPLGGTHVSAD